MRLPLLLLMLAAFAALPAHDRPAGAAPWDGASREVPPADTLAAALPWPGCAAARLDSLLGDALLSTSQLGLMVYDLTADSVLYRYNERQTLRPASTQKILTAVAAIDVLGGSHRFATSLHYTGTLAGGTLAGNLYCVGGMDPALDAADLEAFVGSVAQLGVDTIRGRLVADLSMKDGDRLGEGWCWDDDNPVLSPLLLSRKDTFMAVFTERLRAAGIVVEGAVETGVLPEGAALLCRRTHTLDQVLMPMMKESDNLCAEAMFYHIAAAGGHRPATARHAAAALRRVIRKAGCNPADCKIADGSGLSLYNYATAELMVALLRYAYRDGHMFARLYASLPVAGEDGTLEKRMRGGAAAGNVRAKTGTLTGITSLAGYCTAANGHLLCFAMINQGVLRSSQGRAFQDRVCEALCRP